MKVALCFWGICRSTNWTIESIESCIFQPLKNAGIEYDVFLHTYVLYKPYTNPRANEYFIQLKNTSWKLLNPKVWKVENLDSIDIKLNLEQYRTQGNPWNDDNNTFITLDNHIRALWSLKQVTSLWKNTHVQYDAIIYLRPDVLFLKTLDVKLLSKLSNDMIYIPDFQLHNGCNDRFAIGNPAVMEIYGNRFKGALGYSKFNKLHSEQYLAYTLQNANIQIQLIPFFFKRIRANGEVCLSDNNL
jgi:hypothetical protein